MVIPIAYNQRGDHARFSLCALVFKWCMVISRFAVFCNHRGVPTNDRAGVQ